jgi:Cu/Ag efflux pump CusA
LTDIRNLLIDTPSGDQVRLGEVADIRIAPTPIIIKRDAVSRFVDVNVHVSGRSLGSVANDIKRRIEDIEVPFEYRAEVLSDYADRQAMQWRTLAAVVIAVIGSFLLMQASFDSWRLAFVTLLALPMALTGGVLAALLVSDVSLGSLFGLLTVLGIAVRNSIVLIDHYRHLQLYENQPWGPDLVLQGARDRLVPILMTALTTGFVLLPLVVGGSVSGYEFVHPLAVVILGGLITSTLLCLFVLPTVFLRFGAAVSVPTPSSMSASPQPDFEVAR